MALTRGSTGSTEGAGVAAAFFVTFLFGCLAGITAVDGTVVDDEVSG